MHQASLLAFLFDPFGVVPDGRLSSGGVAPGYFINPLQGFFAGAGVSGSQLFLRLFLERAKRSIP